MSLKQENEKQGRVEIMLDLPTTSFIRFKGALLAKYPGSYGFKPVSDPFFDQLCYDTFGKGISSGSIRELKHAVDSTATDLSGNDKYIAFGDRVWDSQKLEFINDPLEVQPIYSSPVPICSDPHQIDLVNKYFLQLADGDVELANDYPQMMAPLFMHRKPLGIIWALGDGANGKSIFLESLKPVFGDNISHLTMEMIEDGRATPTLRGKLGNIVSETSEKRVDDTQKYKNIGAHESFPVRVLGTHAVVTVDTNFHTIFSANNIPAFSDKTMGARRRTILVTFPAVFEQDETYTERTFTRQFLGAMLHIYLDTAKEIAKHGYQWSPATIAAQHVYNKNANTAEAFAKHLDETGVVGFYNYTRLRYQYDSWCSNQSIVPLGRTQLARGVEKILKVRPVAFKVDGVTVRAYLTKPHATNDDVDFWENGNATSKLAADTAPTPELKQRLSHEW